MTTLQGWRKAVGALKDSTTVGLANLNSDYKDLDVAIVKATNHVECPPKERHLRKIMTATSMVRPRADVAYCIHALHRRLIKTRNWTVALKALIVIHRILREGDPTFREELLNFSHKMHILQLSNFKDDSSPIAWDCSAWVRTYALYLEERLECFRILKYDIEAERLVRPDDSDTAHSKTRILESQDLLEQLPALQQLLYRLVGGRPEGAASSNYVIQYALALVLKESFKIYCAINDGIINLVDKFFEMPRHEAIKALEIYRQAGQQAGSLSEFYEVCRGLELARNFQFPNLREPPQSFLGTMEEYIKEAPRVVPVLSEQLEFPERLLLTYKPEEDSAVAPPENSNEILEEPKEVPIPIPIPEEKQEEVVHPPKPPMPDDDDLLGLHEFSADAVKLEENNALALAIVSSDPTVSTNTGSAQDIIKDPTGWELALVTADTTASSTTESTLVGGLDKLTLDSLYDEATYRQTQPIYGGAQHNPFMTPDPFNMSNNIAPPPSVQMAAVSQQQHPQMIQPFQANPFGQSIQQQHPNNMNVAANPFGDTDSFGGFSTYHHPQQQANPFGSAGLL